MRRLVVLYMCIKFQIADERPFSALYAFRECPTQAEIGCGTGRECTAFGDRSTGGGSPPLYGNNEALMHIYAAVRKRVETR